MSKYLFYPLIFVLACVQAAFLPVNLVLMILVLWWGFADSAGQIFFWSCLAGLFLDLATGSWLGASSLVFMFFGLVFYLYRRRFDYRVAWLIAIYVFVMCLVFDRIVYGQFYIWGSILVAVFTLALSFILNNFWIWERQDRRIKLRN